MARFKFSPEELEELESVCKITWSPGCQCWPCTAKQAVAHWLLDENDRITPGAYAGPAPQGRSYTTGKFYRGRRDWRNLRFVARKRCEAK